MQIVDYRTGNWNKPCVLLLGYFDGVHVGHRALIAKAKKTAEEHGWTVGIMTFYDSKRGGQIFLFDELLDGPIFNGPPSSLTAAPSASSMADTPPQPQNTPAK